jgi:hypothetical protein
MREDERMILVFLVYHLICRRSKALIEEPPQMGRLVDDAKPRLVPEGVLLVPVVADLDVRRRTEVDVTETLNVDAGDPDLAVLRREGGTRDAGIAEVVRDLAAVEDVAFVARRQDDEAGLVALSVVVGERTVAAEAVVATLEGESQVLAVEGVHERIRLGVHLQGQPFFVTDGDGQNGDIHVVSKLYSGMEFPNLSLYTTILL